ncbi:MAG TPA: hypothetical protein VNL92_02275 [Dehalococcoidia bacterium]|nr:hypothetical protein [Dehalococcoidia bacterium]
MAKVHRVGDLEIDEDMSFQRRQWRVERIGWLLMAAFLLAALLGLFGSGVFDDVTFGEKSDPARIEVDRFTRFDAPTRLRVHITSDAVADERVVLFLSRDYLEHVQLEAITPEPESVRLEGVWQVYEFEAEPAEGVIIFTLRPLSAGSLSGRAAIEGSEPIEFDQFVFP